MEFNATFIVAFISFIIFTFVMNLILYKPVCDIIAKRKRTVDLNYEEANTNIDKKVALLLERDEKLEQAVKDAKALLELKTSESLQRKDDITQKAKEEAKKNIDAYNQYYENAAAQAKEILHKETIDLAQLISDKLLGVYEEISADEFDEIIKR